MFVVEQSEHFGRLARCWTAVVTTVLICCRDTPTQPF
jgi:hypothetical protein